MPEVEAQLTIEENGSPRPFRITDLPVDPATETTLDAIRSILEDSNTEEHATEATLLLIKATLLTIAANQANAQQVARVARGDGTLVDASHPLPVDVGGNIHIDALNVVFSSVVSTKNSRATPLGANETFIGEWEDVIDYGSITAMYLTDADSAPNGALVQFSDDGVNVTTTVFGTVPASTPGFASFEPEGRYFRVVYTNGPVAQTFIRNQIVLRFQALTPQTLMGVPATDASRTQFTKAHLAARIMSGPYAGLWNALGTDGLGALLTAITSIPLPPGASTEATQAKRYGGGKSAATAQATASGDTTILAPSAGKKLRVYWVAALNDPDQSQSPRIRIGFDGATDYLYSGFAMSHWEVFEGATDQALVCNLDQTGDVAITVHYEEIT